MARFLNLWLAPLCVGLAGCGTANLNPPTARANTGYVDFYTESSLGLSWEVKRAVGATGAMQTVYSEFEPLEGTVLRLATPPGDYRFQIWFMNQATEGPQSVQVKVEDGKITPVRVVLEAAGTAAIDRKVYGFRPSAKGYGRGTKIVSDENAVYRIKPMAESPRAYETKERMPYFSAGPPAK
jgi:hypothetical protein